MRARAFSSRYLGFLGLLLTTVASAAALEMSSPFLPASGPPSNTVITTGAPIELHGYMMTPEGEKFSIYDPAKKSATWVKVNEKGYPFVVRSYKVENSTDQITVDYQGSTLTLALKQSKIAPATQAPGPAQAFGGRVGGGFAAGGPGRGGPPQTAAVPVVPTAEEATRLQAAAIDFQQRQAQRQQTAAAFQAAQGVQPVAPAAQAGQRGPRAQQQNGQQQNNGATRRAQRGQ